MPEEPDVRVEPFLIARHPLTVAQVRHWLPAYEDGFAESATSTARLEDDLDDLLAALPFRLPSEAEWEYANAFGLAAMGSANEICADVWIPHLTDAPADARPRTGDGPRVVRGGGGHLHPWQGCDEWLLLMSATRGPCHDFTAVRPVAPVPTGRPSTGA
ncbi:hypothetical protein [Streptomyces sp. NPDC002640]